MDITLLEDEIIISNNTLSEDGREEIIYEIMNIYLSIKNQKDDLTIMELTSMSDKNLVFSLMAAYEYFAVKFFSENRVL